MKTIILSVIDVARRCYAEWAANWIDNEATSELNEVNTHQGETGR